jgi:phosphoesterase RecJ-like protein
MKHIGKIRELLGVPRRIVIVTHPRPDGDAMGSSLGLHNYLSKKGHHSTVILPTEFPDYFKWMKNSRDALIYTRKKEQCKAAMAGAEIVFCLDFNSLPRIAPVDKLFDGITAPVVLIDHHLGPDEFEYMLHSVEASSTCELVYEFLLMLEGEQLKIDRDVAQCLYTGLLTDTGNFQNNNTTIRSFELAAQLLKAGVDINYIREKVFSNFKEKRIRFIGNALVNRMVVMRDLKTAYITVTKEDVRKYDLDAGDTEGLVNYPLTIRGIKVAALVKEHGDVIKLSFRSKGNISVNDFARKYFSGGGHKNAAGGRSEKSLQATLIELVNYWKKEYSR